MIVTEADRQAAKDAREASENAPKKVMSHRAKSALGRGSCQDCSLPWDCVETGGHISLSESSDWICSRCFTSAPVREKYFPLAKPRPLTYGQKRLKRLSKAPKNAPASALESRV